MLVDTEQMKRAGISVVMGSLWTARDQPKTSDDYEEIYIHSKVAIVDAAAFTIGSANLNLRSMAFDSELNVISQASDVAFTLRRELFTQVIDNISPLKFGDMAETFDLWKNQMSDNLTYKRRISPLKGMLVKFDVNRKPGAPVI